MANCVFLLRKNHLVSEVFRYYIFDGRSKPRTDKAILWWVGGTTGKIAMATPLLSRYFLAQKREFRPVEVHMQGYQVPEMSLPFGIAWLWLRIVRETGGASLLSPSPTLSFVIKHSGGKCVLRTVYAVSGRQSRAPEPGTRAGHQSRAPEPGTRAG